MLLNMSILSLGCAKNSFTTLDELWLQIPWEMFSELEPRKDNNNIYLWTVGWEPFVTL